MTKFDIEALRFRLREKAPYFATILWRLRPVANESFGFQDDKGNIHGTFGVTANGTLIYNPNVEWTFDECVGGLCHEIHHLILRHSARCDGRNPRIWNMAADLEINSALLAGEWTLPTRLNPNGTREPSVLLPSLFDYPDNLLAETYYRMLIDDAIEIPISSMSPGNGDCGTVAHDKPGDDDDGKAGDSLTDIELSAAAKRVAEDVIKHAGKVPAPLQRWAEGLLNPTIPWQTLLRAATKRCVNIVSGGASDYSFMRADDRRSDGDLILPKMVTYRPEVAIVFDTSGSMGRSELVEGVSEVHGVVRHLTQRVSVVACDAAVHEVYRITNPRALLTLPLSGGGGTDMGVGLNYATSDLRPKPNIIVVFTDGFTPWPTTAPRGVHVIVCLSSLGTALDTVPSWARVVKIGGMEHD